VIQNRTVNATLTRVIRPTWRTATNIIFYNKYYGEDDIKPGSIPGNTRLFPKSFLTWRAEQPPV
jgi:hypothetical protein